MDEFAKPWIKTEFIRSASSPPDTLLVCSREMLALERELMSHGICSPDVLDDFSKLSMSGQES